MQSINGMAEEFRKMLACPEGIELPGCYDVLSAMILERAGFRSVFMSGYGIAASLLGNPDNGYGNEDNVVRTVHELEHAGAAAMILEDQVFPKRCGHAASKSVLPLEQ